MPQSQLALWVDIDVCKEKMGKPVQGVHVATATFLGL